MPVDFAAWLERPQRRMQWLVRVDAIDPSTGAAVPLRFSTHGYMTRHDEPVESASVYWDEALDEGFSFVRSIWSGERIGTEVTGDYGFLTLLDHRRSLDSVRGLILEGAPVRIYLGGIPGLPPGDPLDFRYFSDFRLIHSGTIRAIEQGPRQVVLYMDDGGAAFDEPLHGARYAGTGGNEGTEDLKGKAKPACLGYCLGIAPTLVNPTNLTFQYHFRPAQQVVAVYSRGATISTSDYIVDLAQGLFALTVNHPPPITADVRGDAGPAGGQYVFNPVLLARRALSIGGIPDAEVDEASFTALAASRSGEAGVFFEGGREETATVRQAVNVLIGGSMDWWGRNRSYMVRVGGWAAPSGTPVLALDTDINCFEPEPIPPPPPIWKLRIGCARNHTILQGGDIAGSLYQTTREMHIKQDYRFVEAKNDAVKTRFKFAQEMDLHSPFVFEAEAQREANRILPLLSGVSRLFRVSAGVLPMNVQLGDVVSLRAGRYGLDAGKLFRILAFEEFGGRRNAAVGATSNSANARSSRSTMTLWAPPEPVT